MIPRRLRKEFARLPRYGGVTVPPELLGVPLEHSNEKLINVHDAQTCARMGRPCAIHNRTNHLMRSFPQHWRSDRRIIERICPHGVGHPDPDSPWHPTAPEWTHGCDGCCKPLEDTR